MEAEILKTFASLEINDDQFGVSVGPEGFWEQTKNTYLIGLLPIEVRARLKRFVIDSIKTADIPQKFEWPMRRFTVRKKSVTE